jgi:hypothetical protein
MQLKKIAIFAILVFSFNGLPPTVSADHSWGNYHWARTANPFTLELGKNLSSAWSGYLATAADDWSASVVLDTVVKPGRTTSRACKATNGRVEVCNNRYGSNGWLGLAQIWVSGNHIVKGIVKVNDSYFNTSAYNTPAWRNLVMCQEVGHTLGLDHQDEDFYNANLGTCMDYTNNPSDNQHPNTHDYEQLEIIYAHLDNVNTVFSSTIGARGRVESQLVRNRLEDMNQDNKDIELDDPTTWGKLVKRDARGRSSLYSRDLGRGEKVFTFVTWVQ